MAGIMDPTSILKELQSINDDRVKNIPAAREDMLVIAQKLVASLMLPSELLMSTGMTGPNKSACMRIALDLEIFETLTKHGAEGASAAELAKPKGADVSLVSRIMKQLVATWVVAEIGSDRYRHSSLSAELNEPKYAGGITFLHDIAGLSVQKSPTYLRETQWKDPHDASDGPFQYAFHTKTHLFPWLAENPIYQKAFANYMGGYRSGKKYWFSTELFPVKSQLIDGHLAEENEIVLVDVGGGKGQDLLRLVDAFPVLADKLILQDQAAVLASIDPPLPATIKAMTHDFFTPQPIKHARAYFMHSIIHDWPDEECVKILENLKSAMKPGYSKVLVHDLLIPDQGASWFVTSMDLTISNLIAGRERTESEFKALFKAAGLQVDKVWTYEQGTEVIVEASIPV